jgi:alpha-L-rhamnosidase
MPRHLVLTRVCLIAAACLIATPTSHAQSPYSPAVATQLRCEYLTDPEGIDETIPRLSWIMADSRRGATQTAYHILVADSLSELNDSVGNLWDSGKVESSQSIQIVYEGKSLRSRDQVWWMVRIWDQDGRPSAWSEPAYWSMGLINPEDWQGRWIGDTTPTPSLEGRPAHNGYHSAFVDHPNAEKWVQIDLGTQTSIDGVRLYPANPFDWQDDPNFMFPKRFKIVVSTTLDFANATVVVDHTETDVPAPNGEPQTYHFAAVKARYVRLVATKLRKRDAENYGLSLAEMQVLSGDRNLAQGKPVIATDTVEQGSWSSSRLVDGDLRSHGFEGMEPLTPPRLRKEFVVENPLAVQRAVAYVTALGLYELNINGQRVGDRLLAPEWTDYHKRVQYQTYDVTDFLRGNENAIGVQLADGWYSGRVGLAHIVPGGRPRAIYGRRPRLLFQLELEHADGSIQRIVSDDTWRLTTEGPLRIADLLEGETYDARRTMPGWTEPGFDDSNWDEAGIADPPDIRVVAQPNEPIRKTREINPVELTEPQPGVYVFDMGQNFAGWCRLKVQGEVGQTITMRHAEVLNPEDGMVYTDNLGDAWATDRYTLSGEDVEVYEPHFTYHGFRFVEVTGLTEKPKLELLTGCVVNSDAPEIGTFECSSPLLNQLWRNIRWTQRANMYSIPTDCPQRAERLGWMGDILAFAQAGCFNMDMAAFLSKWTVDVRDAQVRDGRYPDFAPHPFDPAARFSAVPAWGDAGVFVPWRQYQNYGDRRLLAQHFNSARRWVDWIHEQNPNLLWKNKRHNDYGDWLNGDTIELEGYPRKGGQMPKDAFGTAFFARSAQLVAEMAKVLGREGDAKRYEALASDIRKAFMDAYVDAEGRIAGDTQAGYALALQFDLLPEEMRVGAARRMVDALEGYDGRISTGFHTTILLMRSLTEYGYLDEAYRLINSRKAPSWGYAIDHGATTVWERWDAYIEGRGYRVGMNSFSHYSIGAVGEWMYRTILGINPDPQTPAYKRFIIRPEPGGDLTWARGSYGSIHGNIAVSWRREADRLLIEVTVPANTTATAYLPTSSLDGVRESGVQESGVPLNKADGVSNARLSNGSVVCELAAGTYKFEMPARDGS